LGYRIWLVAVTLAVIVGAGQAEAQLFGFLGCRTCSPGPIRSWANGGSRGEPHCPECERWGLAPYCVEPERVPRDRMPDRPGGERAPTPAERAPGPAAPAPSARAPAPGERGPSPAEAPEAPALGTGDELLADTFGAGYGYESSAPNVIGDFFGGAAQRIVIRNTVPFTRHVRGFLAGGSTGGPGSASAVLIYEAGPGTPNDFTSTGLGTDASGDSLADTFAITEPVPPNDSPVSPGPGFVFDGGTAVYTDSVALTTAQNGQFSDGEIWYASYSFSETLVIDIPAGGGAVVRRIKLAENNSPEPRDRLYFNYNYFNNVPNGFNDVNRYVFGFEKTFRDGGMSIDVRVPFASTLATDQVAEEAGTKDTEFGNLTMIWKTLLYESQQTLVSGGLGVAAPTGDDTRLYRLDGRQILQIRNESVHLLPYVAVLSSPIDSLFLQGFLQFDVDANGNPAFGNAAGGGLGSIGTLHDPTLMFIDVALGYRWYQNQYAVITSIVPLIELHYSTTLQHADALTGGGLTLSSVSPRFDIVNMTMGAQFSLGNQFSVTPAIVVPLRSGDDRQFDMEAVVLANWNF
jgi:hypothetical protein